MRKYVVSRPTLHSRKVRLDADDSEHECVYFCHVPDKEILCLAPPHVQASWKFHIGRLQLSQDSKELLEKRIWNFALKTHICDLHELDAEWEEITKFVLRLAGSNSVSYSLPQNLRFSKHVGSRQDLDPDDTENHHEILNLVQQINAEVREGLPNFLDATTLSSLRTKMRGLVKSLCSSTLSAKEIHVCIESMQDVSQEIERKIQGRNHSGKGTRALPKSGHCSNTSGQPDSAVSAGVNFDVIVKVMEKIYKKAPFWCQRFNSMGFTMNTKASSWSESLNSAIRKIIPKLLTLKHHYGLDSLVMDIDHWADGMCEKAYSAHNGWVLPPKRSEFTTRERSELCSFLSNCAVDKIDSIAVGDGTDIRWTFSEQRWVKEETVPGEMKTSINMLCEKYEIPASDIRYVQPGLKSHPCLDQSGKGQKTWKDMVDSASKQINAPKVPTLACYYPTKECRIPCLSGCKSRGFALFCSCQWQTAAGLPCAHQLAWILDRESRSMRNVLWLSHPTFIRGHDLSSAAQGELTTVFSLKRVVLHFLVLKFV